MLADAGALVALLDRGDPYHAVTMAATRQIGAAQMVTTWPCFTEAMYLLGQTGGHARQSLLWRLRSEGRLRLHDLSPDEVDRAEALMKQYRDTPMDLADASLVAAAERLDTRRIFTLDRHFRIYRLPGGGVMEVIPG
jgi:uncharacterized protein